MPAAASGPAALSPIATSTVQRTIAGVDRHIVATRATGGATTSMAPEPAFAGEDGRRGTSTFTGFAPGDDGTLWAADDAEPVPTVQREADTAPAGAVPAAPTITAVATAGPAAAEAKPRTEAELQELCRALYPPLRRRLCRDLLVDRERAGYRTDIRF